MVFGMATSWVALKLRKHSKENDDPLTAREDKHLGVRPAQFLFNEWRNSSLRVSLPQNFVGSIDSCVAVKYWLGTFKKFFALKIEGRSDWTQSICIAATTDASSWSKHNGINPLQELPRANIWLWVIPRHELEFNKVICWLDNEPKDWEGIIEIWPSVTSAKIDTFKAPRHGPWNAEQMCAGISINWANEIPAHADGCKLKRSTVSIFWKQIGSTAEIVLSSKLDQSVGQSKGRKNTDPTNNRSRTKNALAMVGCFGFHENGSGPFPNESSKERFFVIISQIHPRQSRHNNHNVRIHCATKYLVFIGTKAVRRCFLLLSPIARNLLRPFPTENKYLRITDDLYP